MKTTLALCLILLAAGAARAAEPAQVLVPAPTVATLPAGALKAASVALADFSEHLKAEPASQDMRPWMQALRAVENYTVVVGRDGKDWVVSFAPAVKDLRGEDVKAGGAQYRVDAASYRVVGKSFAN